VTLLPVFLKLEGRKVLLVGAGPVARGKLSSLLEAGAQVTLVAPDASEVLASPHVEVIRRCFCPEDLTGAWFVVSAATGEVNREVAQAAEARGIFVNAVDDPACASAYLGGVLRRKGMTVAVSTDGQAPALAGLVREGLDALLPRELGAWLERATALRAEWRADGVPISERRPRLLEALNALYRQPLAPAPGGFVSLVGAGPGDPDLLTRRAAQRLAEADVVLYDALVPPEVLALAPHAHHFFVGKRARRKSMRQETIHRLMVRVARRGRRVVRLKCGDPVVFGRGGEEALALAQAGVPFELVPGVTSAIAAAELAGVPVTHRGLASAFVVVSGHSEAAYSPVLEGLAPRSATLVVLMGLATRGSLAQKLLARGWPAGTPAAVLWAASTPRARQWFGTLEGLCEAPDESGEAAGTVVVGDVVGLARTLGRSGDATEVADGRCG
jgi:uroporphyrin-III C-methyltransferase/precorrin-2 dehydrogenase/sirohydrochlorin ferrochelatase